MKQRTAAWAASAALFLVACGPNDEDGSGMTFAEACAFVEGCEAPSYVVSGPTVAIWRVTVVNETDGTYHIRDVDEVAVAASLGPPPSPLGGQRALAALDADGKPLEVHLLNFADTITWEALDAAPVETPVDGPLSTVGYLTADPLAKTLAIVQDDGTIDDFLDAPKLGVPLVQRTDSRVFESNPPLSACSHVQIISDAPVAVDDVVVMDPIHEALIQSSLHMLTPAHCAGVGRVVLVDSARSTTGGGVAAWTGDLIEINRGLQDGAAAFDARTLARSPESRAFFRHSVIHEAAHTAHNLINSRHDSVNYVGDWAPSEVSTMFAAVKKMRLKAGLDPAWMQLHNSFLLLAWAEPHLKLPGTTQQKIDEEMNAIKDLPHDQITERGFISVYGAKDVNEDFAETVTHPITRKLFEDSNIEYGLGAKRGDLGCKTLNERPPGRVNHRVAALYTKLSMVRDMGMITQEQFDDCVGPVGLARPDTRLALFVDDELSLTFRDVTTHFGTERVYEFAIQAKGDVPTTEGVRVGNFTFFTHPLWPPGIADHNRRDASYVRGAFRVELDGLDTRPPDTRQSITFENDRHLSHYATDGYALIARATDDVYEGAIIINAAERTFAPFGVPHEMPAPYHYRFNIPR